MNTCFVVLRGSWCFLMNRTSWLRIQIKSGWKILIRFWIKSSLALSNVRVYSALSCWFGARIVIIKISKWILCFNFLRSNWRLIISYLASSATIWWLIMNRIWNSWWNIPTWEGLCWLWIASKSSSWLISQGWYTVNFSFSRLLSRLT